MTTEAMKTKMERSGYKVTRGMSGVIIITPPSGFKRSFKTITEAYKFYF